MRPRGILGALAAGAVLVAAVVSIVPTAAADTSLARRCAPPRGPGDTAVHSTNLRVTNITCNVGRRVALTCVRFTYGHSGTCVAVGYRWRCTSTKPPGSESAQCCAAGRRLMTILWTD
jgi:hypothetical protein